MLKNYFKIMWRSLVRRKTFSLLNILGLSFGITSSILIFLWVRDEISYDTFNVNAENIYRITSNVSGIDAAVVPVPMGLAVGKAIPEIINTTRINATKNIFTVNNKKFEENRIFYADTNFLRIFSYPLLSGSISEVLSRPDGIVITASVAKKYFGTIDVIGKTIIADNDIRSHSLSVTGVLKDIPSNSHLQFDFLLPISLYEKTIDYDGSWGNSDVYTYIQMDNHFKPSKINIQKANRRLNDLFVQNDNTHSKAEFSIQPLTDIHLRSNHLLLDVSGQGSQEYVRIFSLVALFILLIACINFMNLSTALSSQRAKEVGLRKTIGAMRSHLIAQFLGESIMLAIISTIMGIAIASLLLPFFNELTGKNISFSLGDPEIVTGLVSIAIIVGLASGAYPAAYLSSFKPVKALKGIRFIAGHKSFLRNGLVIVQFSIAIVLMISTLVVFKQLQFIRNRDIGFHKENLMYLKMPQSGDLANNYETLKATLNQYPNISDYSIIKYLPTDLTTGTTDVIWAGKDPHLQVLFPHLGVDENFAKTFGVKVIAGRFFAKDFHDDENNYVVNEAALKIMNMGTASAIGKGLTFNGREGKIIGVVKDFNFKPVRKVVEPLVLRMNKSGGYLVIRTSPAIMQNIIPQVRSVFKNVYADYPFSYGFVDEDLSKLYISEQQMGKFFDLFAGLTIFIACLGLFGLAAYDSQRRVKEIGVRKVLGASVTGILSMLSKEFLKPVAFAALLAYPVAWWLMNTWLQGFVYRIGISWWIFIDSTIAALAIAFITISFQTIKSATSNPVDSLRSE